MADISRASDHLSGVLATLREPPSGEWHKVWATTFLEDGKHGRAKGVAWKGLHGDYSMHDEDVIAALPDRSALGRSIEVRYEPTGRVVRLLVADIGPWWGAKVADSSYVHGFMRPLAEAAHVVAKAAATRGEKCPPEGRDDQGRPVLNPAGIDLSPAAWAALGVVREEAYSVTYSATVSWRWADLEK